MRSKPVRSTTSPRLNGLLNAGKMMQDRAGARYGLQFVSSVALLRSAHTDPNLLKEPTTEAII